jgi:hypothetical protein
MRYVPYEICHEYHNTVNVDLLAPHCVHQTVSLNNADAARLKSPPPWIIMEIDLTVFSHG